MNLHERIQSIKSEMDPVAESFYLNQTLSLSTDIDRHAKSDSTADQYKSELMKLTDINGFASDGKAIERFMQIFGEGIFYCNCKDANIPIIRIPEGKSKSPDFRVVDTNISFEVKTLSTVYGNGTLQIDINESLDSKIDIERQIMDGSNCAFSERVIQPYQNKGLSKKSRIETIIQKTNGNVKPGQYPDKTSFLVLNLMALSINNADGNALRPLSFQNNNPVSGELWMSAFSQVGYPIFESPEFEGLPTLIDHMALGGTLRDDSNLDIAGIIFAVNGLSGRLDYSGLVRAARWEKIESADRTYIDRLIGENWNDEGDSNGWQLS